MAKFKITIERQETIEQNSIAYQKVADTGNPRDGGALFEYVPYRSAVNVEKRIYEQLVDDLDIRAVIDAVNSKATGEPA